MVDNLIVWLLVFVAGSWIASLAVPFCLRIVAHTDPEDRSVLFLFYAIMPGLSALLVVILHSFPGLATGLVPHHCHSHNCAPHAPEIALCSLAGCTLTVISLVTIGALATACFVALNRNCRKLQTLYHFSMPHQTIDYRTISDPRPFAWCTGMLGQQIYISTGLLERLTPHQLQAVLVHESVHKARMDNLRRAIARYATCFWLPANRKLFVAEFDEVTEQTCHVITTLQLDAPQLLAAVAEVIGSDNFACSPIEKPPSFRYRSAPGVPCAQPGLITSGWLFAATLWILEVMVFTGSTHTALEWLTLGGF